MASLSAIRRTGGRPEQAARCGAGKKEQTTFRTTGLIANGFLKHRFLPLYQQGGRLPEKKRVETGFFKSLSCLSDWYGLKPMDVSDKAYPYNILLAHWDAKRQLARVNTGMELFITKDENKVGLSSTETVNTGSTLFYIPVLPLYRLLQDRRQKKCAELLLSVFSYLLHVAAVPYYRDEGAYLFYHYEILEEWEEDTEAEGYLLHWSALKAASRYGDIMQRKIYNPCHLSHFSERVNSFAPKDSFQCDCLKIARAALDIWVQYPDHTIYEHIVKADEEADGEQDECVRIDEYVSFIAEAKGSLYDNISEMVNSEFNERLSIQEPTISRQYDGSDKKDGSLDFERQLFAMIADLCTLLNELP